MTKKDNCINNCSNNSMPIKSRNCKPLSLSNTDLSSKQNKTNFNRRESKWDRNNSKNCNSKSKGKFNCNNLITSPNSNSRSRKITKRVRNNPIRKKSKREMTKSTSIARGPSTTNGCKKKRKSPLKKNLPTDLFSSEKTN